MVVVRGQEGFIKNKWVDMVLFNVLFAEWKGGNKSLLWLAIIT
jgi:hypothetical protein